jgi:hypothetical protein
MIKASTASRRRRVQRQRPEGREQPMHEPEGREEHDSDSVSE